MKVEKERASERFTTLERFSLEASGPLFFTMDREGQNKEGFIMVKYPRISWDILGDYLLDCPLEDYQRIPWNPRVIYGILKDSMESLRISCNP